MGKSESITVKIKKLDKAARLPSYESTGAAGADIYACLAESVHVQPMQRVRIPTGLALELPPGYEAQIRPRSGTAFKHGLTVVNAPGTIDEDYRGELGILLVNLGKDTYEIKDGDRIAQMIIAPVHQALFLEAEELTSTKRGIGGFGSTGT